LRPEDEIALWSLAGKGGSTADKHGGP